MKNLKATKTSTTFSSNMRRLKNEMRLSSEEISKRSGVSERMVDYLLAGDRVPSVNVADAIGTAFGVTGWQMLYPDLTTDLAKRGHLKKLLENYSACSDSGKDFIEQVACREANTRTRE